MSQKDGWIALHRKLIDDIVWKGSTPEQKVVLITVLLMVDHSPNEWEWKGKKFKTKPGQTITSINSIITNAGKKITKQNVRSALNRFEKMDFLTNEPTQTGRLITIIKWGTYQGKNKRPNIEPNIAPTQAQHSANIAPTPNNNVNNENNDNNVKNKGDFSFPESWPESIVEKFKEYIEHRKEIKKKITLRAFNQQINFLEKESGGDLNTAIEIIDQTIRNSWTGLFPLNKKMITKTSGNMDAVKEFLNGYS